MSAPSSLPRAAAVLPCSLPACAGGAQSSTALSRGVQRVRRATAQSARDGCGSLDALVATCYSAGCRGGAVLVSGEWRVKSLTSWRRSSRRRAASRRRSTSDARASHRPPARTTRASGRTPRTSPSSPPPPHAARRKKDSGQQQLRTVLCCAVLRAPSAPPPRAAATAAAAAAATPRGSPTNQHNRSNNWPVVPSCAVPCRAAVALPPAQHPPRRSRTSRDRDGVPFALPRPPPPPPQPQQQQQQQQ